MDKQLDDELKELEIIALNEKAENAVAVAVAATAATGAIPIPFADAPLMIGEQVTLMATICGIYGIDIGKDGLKMLATTAISAGGAAIIGKTVATNLLKLIPGAGSLAGGAISAGTAGLVTLAMGKAFIEVCKMVKLGKLSEADVTSSKGVSIMKDQFKDQLNKNKKYTMNQEAGDIPNEALDVIEDNNDLDNKIPQNLKVCEDNKNVQAQLAITQKIKIAPSYQQRTYANNIEKEESVSIKAFIQQGTICKGDKVLVCMMKGETTKEACIQRLFAKGEINYAGEGATVNIILEGVGYDEIAEGDIIVKLY